VAVGEPILLGLLAVVLLLITVRQPNCNREEAVDVLHLTFHRWILLGELLMMFKASRRGSARIRKSSSVLSALRTTTQTSVRNSAGQNRRWLSAVLQRMVWASFRFRLRGVTKLLTLLRFLLLH
jgi:hypothetical protein